MIDKGMYYIENELPEFTLSEEGNIKFLSSVNGYDKEYNFKIENIEKDELENKDLNKYYDYSSTLLLLNDKYSPTFIYSTSFSKWEWPL